MMIPIMTLVRAHPGQRARASPPSNVAQVNQFTTVTLRCDQVDCEDRNIAENQFNTHMLTYHSINPFRCAVKHCGQSFTSHLLLHRHLAESHQHITQWKCHKCDHKFTNYHNLSNHNSQLHQLGHFQCTFPSCTFTGEMRIKMHEHYKRQHQSTIECPKPDCAFVTYSSSALKRHELTHSGMKPYGCKWANCDFTSAYKHYTLKHIRVHLAGSKKAAVSSANPTDYLKVSGSK